MVYCGYLDSIPGLYALDFLFNVLILEFNSKSMFASSTIPNRWLDVKGAWKK